MPSCKRAGRESTSPGAGADGTCPAQTGRASTSRGFGSPPGFGSAIPSSLRPRLPFARATHYRQGITTRRLVYWLSALVGLFVVGTAIGLMWADTSNAAGAFAGLTNFLSVAGIAALLIVFIVQRRRSPR